MSGFNCQNCGECCGPIPVSHKELVQIRRNLRKKTADEIIRLKNQRREPFTCPLLDIENKRCSVYNDRPEICRMFGFYRGLECPNNKKFAKGSREEGTKRLEETEREMAGIMSIDFTWDNLIKIAEGV